MIDVIRSDTRGSAELGWLHAKHTFSFGEYHDPERMGFGPLRVINEDRIDAGTGFDTHPHKNMEIVTYIIGGSLEHKDSMGNGSTIAEGELQRMTAGTGVLHSEFNHSDTQTHLLQIWILPEKNGLEPGYEQKLFPRDSKLNRWCLVGSRDGGDGSLTIHQDISLHAAIIEAGQSLDYAFGDGRQGFLQVVRGKLQLDDDTLSDGDGAAITDVDKLTLSAHEDTELLLFDMA